MSGSQDSDAPGSAEARDFVQTLQRRYGVSAEFVSKCCPLIESIYDEFEGAERERLLRVAEATVARHAHTEHVTRDALDRLRGAVGALERQAESARVLGERQARLRAARSGLELAAGQKKRVLH